MKKKISLFIGIMILLSSILMACESHKGAGASHGESEVESYSIEGIKNKGKLVMGTSADFPPNEFHMMIDGKDTIVGYDIEIGKYIADRLGVELEIKDMDFGNLLGGLSTGMLDIVIAGMVNEPEREANFSKPYDLASIHKIVIRKSDESKFKSEEDFNGKTLGVQTASIQKEIASNMEGVRVKELPAINTLIMELKTEKIEGVIISSESANSYVDTNDDLMVIEDIDLKHNEQGACVALKKGNDELTEYIDEIIDELLEQDLVQIWKVEAKELSDQEIKQ
ncbi:transporter substrate-binding domain-containing protein [Tissierellaceae bacterium HCP3S3_D8]